MQRELQRHGLSTVLRRRRCEFHDPLSEKQKRAFVIRPLIGLVLNAVAPVLGNKFPDPSVVIAVENGVFGTPDNQPVHLDKLMSGDVLFLVAKSREGEIRRRSSNCDVRHDPNCEIRREGHDAIEDARVDSRFDSYRIVAGKEGVPVERVDKDLPSGVSEECHEPKDVGDSNSLRILAIHLDLYIPRAKKLDETASSKLLRGQRDLSVGFSNSNCALDHSPWRLSKNAHATRRTGHDVSEKSGDCINSLVVNVVSNELF